MKISLPVQMVFSLSSMEAKALSSRYIDIEHLWLGILKSEDLLALGIKDFQDIGEEDLQLIKSEITILVDKLKIARIECQYARRKLRKLVLETQAEAGEFSGHRTQRCREAFDLAAEIAASQSMESISVFHLAQAILSSDSSLIEAVLSEYGTSKPELIGILGNGAAMQMQNKPVHAQGKQPGDRTARASVLAKFGKEMVWLAREGKIEPVIGRIEEIKKVAQILCQKKKNNPILVGDAGVGKTCIVEGLALKCLDPKAPALLKDLKIYEVSMGSLIAGTKYRGEFEERLDQLVKEASSDPNIVLFIDEIHTMVGAGAGAEGSMNAANILKPALARGEFKCIGATTTGEYRRYIEKDPALERRFQLVWVDEPTRDEAIGILKGVRQKFEEHYEVKILDKAIEAAVDLSIQHLIDFRLPDKAIDLIDQACSQRLLKTLTFSAASDTPQKQTIDLQDIARVVSQRTRIPLEDLTAEENTRFIQMEESLKKHVKGQDQAIKEVAESIRTAKAGLKDPRKPVGVFLFLGSTGTGKTELAKALAGFLFFDKNKLIRIDMSEYQERHSISKLIGAPPGYIGYEDEGLLSSQVRSNPYSVILFDEIEKAHPEVFDIFLQIFDEGMLTDAKGRKINFRESVIILTSNLGANVSGLGKRAIGVSLGKRDKKQAPQFKQPLAVSFGNQPTRAGALDENDEAETGAFDESRWDGYRDSIMNAVSRTLRPELLNRIQKKVIFYPLSKETVKMIIRKILDDINQRLSKKEISVRLEEDAEEFLLAQGYSEKDGARELERTMERCIVQPLSLEILEGRMQAGDSIDISVSGSGEELKFKNVKIGMQKRIK